MKTRYLYNTDIGQDRAVSIHAYYGNKLGLTEEDRSLLAQFERAIPGVPEREVPSYIIAKDYFRTPRITITTAEVIFTYKPRTIDVYLPEQNMLAILGEEVYPTINVLQDKTILYPAIGRLMENVTKVQETMRRGVHYWKSR